MTEKTIKRTKTVRFGKHSAEIVHVAFPAQRFHGAFVSILSTQLQSGDFAKDTLPLIAFVESWTAPGDPKRIESWEALDWITEYGALRRQIMNVVDDHLTESGDVPN